MSAESKHPLQLEVWRVLDRVTHRKEWCHQLRIDPSEISRWATGSRAMSIDDLLAAGRVCAMFGRADAAAEVRRVLTEAFDFEAPPAKPAPIDVVFAAASAAGASATAIREGLADGALDTHDVPALREAAAAHRQAAALLDDLIDHAANVHPLKSGAARV